MNTHIKNQEYIKSIANELFEINPLIKLEVSDFIDENHQAHTWYGGTVATLWYSGYRFDLCANGEIRANLYKNNKIVDSLVDKNAGGEFWSEFRDEITDDNHLVALMNAGQLVFGENNWWECFITSPDGENIEIDWTLDAFTLKEAVLEIAKADLDEIISDL